MSRRKQTKPSPLEDNQMDIERSRIPACHIKSEEDDLTLQEDCISHNGSSVQKESNKTVESQRIYSQFIYAPTKTAEKRERNFSDSEEESVVPYKLYQELQNDYLVLRQHIREKDALIAEKDATIRKLRESYNKMSVELNKLGKLNICLQEHLLKEAGSSAPQTISTEDKKALYKPTENVLVSEVKVQSECLPAAHLENNVGKVDFGHGVLLDRQKWQLIQRTESHSKFCKSLAVAIWGIETLKERSVTGSKSNAVKDSVAKPPLSPKKVGIIRDCLKERLQQRGYPREAVDRQLRLVRRFLSEKICDIKRKVSLKSKVHTPAHHSLPTTTSFSPEIK